MPAFPKIAVAAAVCSSADETVVGVVRLWETPVGEAFQAVLEQRLAGTGRGRTAVTEQ